jgi:methylated-DNA-[protein]-cysteine S-methyltransferase
MKNPPAEERIRYEFVETPVGWIATVFSNAGLRSLLIETDRESLTHRLNILYPQSLQDSHGADVAAALGQLREYFAGRRRQFDMPLDFRGLSDFSLRVLDALQKIPFGQTVTYGELGGRIGRPRAARAVGRVMASNRLPLVLPCHRVIGSLGALTGYSGGQGIATKQWLLEFEKRLS